MQFRSRRRVTSFDVILHTDDAKYRAQIVDITERGARLRLDDTVLDSELPLILAIRGKDYTARVVWQRIGEAGIEFDSLRPLEALSAISRTLHRSVPDKKKRFLMG
jgi:hypothetical protein